MQDLVYNDAFYKNRDRNSAYAAERILGIVFDELSMKPNSIADIGCGVGTWLRVAKEKYGATTVIGVDGDYVPRKYLQISEKEFVPENLEKYEVNKLYQYNQNGRFDLAISMEVAEHVEKRYTEEFIKRLCDLSDAVCFSAAVPQQGGGKHVNEQRLSYWKDLFKKNGYLCGDVIRAEIWEDKRIPIWYRNNAVLFYKKDAVQLKTKAGKGICDIVHPDMFEKKVRLYESEIQRLKESRNLKCLIKEKVREIMKKLQGLL